MDNARHSLLNRFPNGIANRVLAAVRAFWGRFQFRLTPREMRYSRFMAASSFGKWPRTEARSLVLRLSIALIRRTAGGKATNGMTWSHCRCQAGRWWGVSLASKGVRRLCRGIRVTAWWNGFNAATTCLRPAQETKDGEFRVRCTLLVWTWVEPGRTVARDRDLDFGLAGQDALGGGRYGDCEEGLRPVFRPASEPDGARILRA